MVAMLSPASLAGPILEPSGGDGAFIDGLLRIGVPASRICVGDINPATEAPLAALGARVRIGDFLLPAAADETRYAAVIGNPPYLNKQSDYIKANRRALNKAFRAIGVNDTYALFIYKALRDHLAPGGQLVFLVSDTFLTLGIHRRLREYLLANTTIDQIVLLPADTFPDAAVNTAILSVRNAAAGPGHVCVVADLRGQGDQVYRVPQAGFAATPGMVFAFTVADRRSLWLAAAYPSLLTLLNGGLGMHTGDNARFLRQLSFPGEPAPRGRQLQTLPVAEADGSAWRMYHKKGGSQRWYGRAEHAVRWDEASRQAYGIPKTALAGIAEDGTASDGFVVSGVSARLAARTATPGALWESNKAFVFFPKDPKAYPVGFFLAVLNSDVYSGIANALNHTVSLQIRDIKRLPLLPFTKAEVRELARLGAAAASWVQRHPGVGAPPQEGRINQIVSGVADRCLAGKP